jgi:hypothetical protein
MLVLGASAACEVAPAGATTRPAVVEAAAADGGMVFDGRRGLYLEDGGRRTKLPRGAWAGAYWSPNGKLFAYITAKDGRNILGVVDRRGSRRPLVSVPRSGRLGNPSSFAHVSWAPDSRRLAYTREVPLGAQATITSSPSAWTVAARRASRCLWTPVGMARCGRRRTT